MYLSLFLDKEVQEAVSKVITDTEQYAKRL